MTADAVYVDPSALSRLYLNQPGSREMYRWPYERAAVFLSRITGARNWSMRCPWPSSAANARQTKPFRPGRTSRRTSKMAICLQVDLLWRAALNRAAESSRAHTPRLGTRALDVLHVGCALELKLRHFLTFDERQQKLAVVCGLKAAKL